MDLIKKFTEKLLIKSMYLNDQHILQLKKAIDFAEKAHSGQFRITGEPYIIHPLSVCEILMDYKADVSILIAALLHDVVEDTKYTITEIELNFGKDIALMVDGLTKVKRNNLTKEEIDAINVEKLIVTCEKDIRVAIIKIADRIHNMRTLEVKKIEKKIPYANETLNFFAPLAEKLGLFNFKYELEDMAFKYSPYYNSAKKMFDNYNTIFIRNIKSVKSKIETFSTYPKFSIDYRRQSIYSSLSVIHNGLHFSDSFEISIITDTILDCYYILGIVHQSFRPIENRFEDNIAINKNLFQKKLVTKVLIHNMEVKICVQSKEHYFINQLGVFYYLNDTLSKEEIKELIFKNKIQQIKEVSLNPIEFADFFSFELLQNGITVYTPKMDTITLPIGATALDFGFTLSPTTAKRMKNVIINGKVKSIFTILNNLDIIEIKLSDQDTINIELLNNVTTSTAIKEINNLLKR